MSFGVYKSLIPGKLKYTKRSVGLLYSSATLRQAGEGSYKEYEALSYVFPLTVRDYHSDTIKLVI